MERGRNGINFAVDDTLAAINDLLVEFFAIGHLIWVI